MKIDRLAYGSIKIIPPPFILNFLDEEMESLKYLYTLPDKTLDFHKSIKSTSKVGDIWTYFANPSLDINTFKSFEEKCIVSACYGIQTSFFKLTDFGLQVCEILFDNPKNETFKGEF